MGAQWWGPTTVLRGKALHALLICGSCWEKTVLFPFSFPEPQLPAGGAYNGCGKYAEFWL